MCIWKLWSCKQPIFTTVHIAWLQSAGGIYVSSPHFLVGCEHINFETNHSSLFFILLINIGPHLGHSSIWCCCSWLWQEQWACSSYSLPGLWAYTFISLAGRKRGWGHTVVCLLANMHVLQSPENQWVINIKFCAENRVEQKQPFSQWESF